MNFDTQKTPPTQEQIEEERAKVLSSTKTQEKRLAWVAVFISFTTIATLLLAPSLTGGLILNTWSSIATIVVGLIFAVFTLTLTGAYHAKIFLSIAFSCVGITISTYLWLAITGNKVCIPIGMLAWGPLFVWNLAFFSQNNQKSQDLISLPAAMDGRISPGYILDISTTEILGMCHQEKLCEGYRLAVVQQGRDLLVGEIRMFVRATSQEGKAYNLLKSENSIQ